MPVCALYLKCILHEILEFLAMSFHCRQKKKNKTWVYSYLFKFNVTFEFNSVVLVLFFFSFNSLLLVVFLLFGTNLRRIREFQFLWSMFVFCWSICISVNRQLTLRLAKKFVRVFHDDGTGKPKWIFWLIQTFPQSVSYSL